MANELATTREQLPDHLKQYAKTGRERIGNLSESDRIVPRLILLQALSKELTTFEEAKPGMFWHSSACVNLGPKVLAIPITVRKSVVLWAPRGDDRMILARSIDDDCIEWDLPNTEFQVKPKGSAKPVIWNTGPNIPRSGLLDFGSSVPEDRNSIPAASLTLNVLWYMIDRRSSAVMINTRSQLKPTLTMFGRADERPGHYWVQQWELGIIQEKGAEGPYYNITYRAAGYPDDEIAAEATQLHNHYEGQDWAPSEDISKDEAVGGIGDNGERAESTVASKF